MRPDLLNLTQDDLIALSNRGVVNRCVRDAEQGKLELQLSETAGEIQGKWADGIISTIPAGASLAQATCTCPAVGICRHLVALVLVYQTWATTQPPAEAEQAQEPPPATWPVWNPGRLTDEQLSQHYKPADLKKWRKQFDQMGHVVELVESQKPSVRFYTLPYTIRFLVPDDIRYTICNCQEEAPCPHIPLAVWAFRLMDQQAEQENHAQLLETHVVEAVLPTAALADLSQFVLDLAEIGISAGSAALLTRLNRLQALCVEQELIWPGTILEEVAQAVEQYNQQDARFNPSQVAYLLGELLVRQKALQNHTKAVPRLFITGRAADLKGKIDATRLVGLGCEATAVRGGVILSAYLQDQTSGQVVALQSASIDPKPGTADQPKSYGQLATAGVVTDGTIGLLGQKQLLVKGGQQTANGRFKPPAQRAKYSVTPQNFQWEQLRSPVLAEDLAEIRARLAIRPPASLRPRRLGDDLFVLAIKQLHEVRFDGLLQEILAILEDNSGQKLLLRHPFTSRGQAGFEKLLWHLTHKPQAFKFVAGQLLKGGPLGIYIRPVSLVLEQQGQRELLQPWVDSWNGPQAENPAAFHEWGIPRPAHQTFLDEVEQALGELLLLGFQRINEPLIQQWLLLAQQGQALGFVRLSAPVQQLASQLEQSRHVVQWAWQPAGETLLTLLRLVCFSRELHF